MDTREAVAEVLFTFDFGHCSWDETVLPDVRADYLGRADVVLATLDDAGKRGHVDAGELARRKAAALDDIVDAGVSDGNGDCLWCGGKLDLASCGRDGHDGCMGYLNTGEHEPDCILLPFIAGADHALTPAPPCERCTGLAATNDALVAGIQRVREQVGRNSTIDRMLTMLVLRNG